MAMNVIMEHANDQHVCSYVVYGKAADHKLYYEEDFKTQVTKADAENAFRKNRLQIIDTATVLVPIAMTGTTVKTVGGSSTAATLVDWAVKADN